MSNQTKLKKTLNILFRILIIVLTWGYIAYQVFWGRDFNALLESGSGIVTRTVPLLKIFLVLILMLVNWGIESGKWQFMISKIEKVSYFRSVMAVLTGVSVSSFTPNRIGEYFGRVYILDKASHMEGILITILGSMSQLLITILAGTLSLILFIPHIMAGFTGSYAYFTFVIIVLIVFLDIILLLIFFNVPVLLTLKNRILRSKRMEKIRAFFQVFSRFSFTDLARVILLSFARYLVFTIQYWLLLDLFSVPVPFLTTLILISLIFLVISVIPTVFLTELGVRDSVALFIFGIRLSDRGAMTDEIRIGILAASTVLWIINLALPALAGTFFVLRLKFFRKSIGTEKTS